MFVFQRLAHYLPQSKPLNALSTYLSTYLPIIYLSRYPGIHEGLAAKILQGQSELIFSLSLASYCGERKARHEFSFSVKVAASINLRIAVEKSGGIALRSLFLSPLKVKLNR